MMDTATFTVEPARPEVVMCRDFDAPRDLVFRAYVDPDLVARWWGPRSLTSIVERLDARPGGAWRIVQHGEDGEHAFHGFYHLVQPPERIVRTFEYEGAPGHVILESATFEDLGGRTRVVTQAVFQSLEDRDGMVGAGMESGAVESMDRLAELLATG